MLDLVLLIGAPIIQIILSVLRINNYIPLTIGLLSFLMMVLGCVLSFEEVKIVADNLTYQPGQLRCGTGIAAIFIGGSILNITATLIIGIVGGIVYHFTHKKKELTIAPIND
ncbi:MAG TPA: hypothetical protein VFE54_07195 [Mucilaginibacter sp.]|nr:hypothetical protein [Mucilaginibacter sp.]